MKTAGDFWGELHVGYEKVAEYAGVTVSEPKKPTSDRKALYRVEKMRFGRAKEAGGKDKTVIQYNALITVSGIPLKRMEGGWNDSARFMNEWIASRAMPRS